KCRGPPLGNHPQADGRLARVDRRRLHRYEHLAATCYWPVHFRDVQDIDIAVLVEPNRLHGFLLDHSDGHCAEGRPTAAASPIVMPHAVAPLKPVLPVWLSQGADGFSPISVRAPRIMMWPGWCCPYGQRYSAVVSPLLLPDEHRHVDWPACE